MKKSILILFILLWHLSSCELSNNLKGVVLDSASAPVTGAYVSVQGTGIEVQTDEKGRFALQNLPAEANIVISVYHHAYKPYSINTKKAQGDLGEIQIQGIDFEAYPSLIEINNRFDFMRANVIEWPDELYSKLGEIKKYAFMAYPKIKPEGKLPLLISLHGSGGRLRDLETQLKRSSGLKNSSGEYVDGIKALGFVELSKQNIILLEPCSKAKWDTNTLNIMLDYILDTYRDIDQQKIYLMGHSMGGAGAWDWMTKNPEKFAAVAPGSLGGDKGPYDAIRDLPIWFMIAQSDNSGKMEEGRGNKLADGVREVSTTEVKLTVFPGANHSGGNEGMFTHPELLKWMLKFSIQY